MDQKYLSEIKAREQAATPGPWPRDGSIFAANGINNCDFIAAARTDIPALIEQHEQDQQQIATLKKALELEAKYIVEVGRVDYFLCDDIPKPLHLKYQPKNDGNYENEPCIQCVQEYFKNQAQQLTRETHETESEDDHEN